MTLRAMAQPVLGLAHWLYRREGTRRLMVELRESFDDRVCALAGNNPIVFHVASRMEHQRASSVLSKEPETIAWLNDLCPGDLFVDVGANIGVYTLYAAIKRNAKVVAFEPEAQNFAALNRNIAANGVAHSVSAWPFALSDHSGPTTLSLSTLTSGGSHHTAGTAIDEWGKPFSPKHVQGSVAMTLDDAIEAIVPGQCPRFVKVDIDGGEDAVLAGMTKLLNDARLEQILMEMSAERTQAPAVHELMRRAGFAYHHPQTVYKGRGNAIFARSPHKR